MSRAGRTLSAVDSVNNINYATGATYNPVGSITNFKSGEIGGWPTLSPV